MQGKSSTDSGRLELELVPELGMIGAQDANNDFLVMASLCAPEFKAEHRAPVDVVW
jgi:hypothetical protein